MSLESRRLADGLRAARGFVGVNAGTVNAPRDAGISDGSRPFVLGRSEWGGQDVIGGDGGTFVLGTSWWGGPDRLSSSESERPFVLGSSAWGGPDIISSTEES